MLRYLSILSGAMVKASLNLSAAKMFAADEIPPFIPSDGSFFVNSIASSSSISTTSSISSKFSVFGINPAPIPCILWGFIGRDEFFSLL